MGIGGTLWEGSASLGALRRALAAAGEAGAETGFLDLRELDLPMYKPGRSLEEYGPGVGRLVGELRGADAVLISTAAYHGTLASVTKNALDFAQFLSGGEHPYLDGKVVGLISTAGGEQAGANAAGAMVHVVHALRGVVAPLVVSIPKAWQRADGSGNVTDEVYGGRLDALGELVVDLAGGLAARNEETEFAGVAG
ncbi:MAG: NAD(P)H-dependent oxidoreductase [Actinomycetota bacterium]|nr:NAD(P)H-dependent oxidoreductase [Actinomycetota bacterium]